MGYLSEALITIYTKSFCILQCKLQIIVSFHNLLLPYYYEPIYLLSNIYNKAVLGLSRHVLNIVYPNYLAHNIIGLIILTNVRNRFTIFILPHFFWNTRTDPTALLSSLLKQTFRFSRESFWVNNTTKNL